MKKTVASLALASMVALGLTGCGPTDFNKCVKEGTEAPRWVCKPYLEGGVTGLGQANKVNGAPQMQMTMAQADARDNIARSIGVKVKNMVKTFTQTTGTGDASTLDTVASNVSKQISSQTLTGTRIKDSWEHPENGRMYVLMVMDPAYAAQAAQAAVKAVAKTSKGNDQALWQQFQGAKAQADLDAAIASEMAVVPAQ